MANSRAVTEDDFRMPEFRGEKVEDYEIRGDGKPVRKDRWETGLRSIASIMGYSGRDEWEIPEIVEAVRTMASKKTQTSDQQ